jgi:alkaline phosphatase D
MIASSFYVTSQSALGINNREAFRLLVSGDVNGAIAGYKEHMGDPPYDYTALEDFYGLSLCYAHPSDVNIAESMKYVQLAVDNGMPFERFIVGPRNMLTLLYNSSEFQTYAASHTTPEILHGPTLGDVTESSAKVWVRTKTQVPLQVKVSESNDMSNPISSAEVTSDPNEDYTAVLSVSGLDPNTHYYYQVLANGSIVDVNMATEFTTNPAKGSHASFMIAFGGGSGYSVGTFERVWNVVRGREPRAFLAMGDNEYYDTPDVNEVARYCYYRRFSRPEYRQMAAKTAIYAIYDDHDFSGNDCIPGDSIDTPSWKRDIVWRVFKQNWLNPYYGGGYDHPGCYYDFSIGDVDFFMLDCRYYRNNPNQSNSSMLGAIQKQWLLDKLKASTATFKVIASSVPVRPNTKPGLEGADTWDGFPLEREEILSFIENNKIEGVTLISADRHRHDGYKLERPNGYTFYEGMSSRTTNGGTHDVLDPSTDWLFFSYNKKQGFILMIFDTTKPDPEVKYQVVTIDNEAMPNLSFTVKKSQLKFTSDFDFDRDVDITDLVAFTDQWLEQQVEGLPLLRADLNNDANVQFADYAVFTKEYSGPDTTPPIPNPSTWDSEPAALGCTFIEMKANIAIDPNGTPVVEYYFNNITDPNHDSGWQRSRYYGDSNLPSEATYSYRVKARDHSNSLNETDWSTTASATTIAAGTPETIFEKFDTDPTTRDWVSKGTDLCTFTYNPSGYLDATLVRDPFNRAVYYKKLINNFDLTQEFWFEYDIVHVSTNHDYQQSVLGVLNLESGNNHTNALVDRFFYRYFAPNWNHNRHDLWCYASDGIGTQNTGAPLDPGFTFGVPYRSKIHYYYSDANQAGYARSEQYTINPDGTTGDLIQAAIGKDGDINDPNRYRVVLPVGKTISFNMFGLGNRTDSDRVLDTQDMKIDNMYFSTVSENPDPIDPNF